MPGPLDDAHVVTKLPCADLGRAIQARGSANAARS